MIGRGAQSWAGACRKWQLCVCAAKVLRATGRWCELCKPQVLICVTEAAGRIFMDTSCRVLSLISDLTGGLRCSTPPVGSELAMHEIGADECWIVERLMILLAGAVLMPCLLHLLDTVSFLMMKALTVFLAHALLLKGILRKLQVTAI